VQSICIGVKTSEAVELIRHDERLAEGAQTWCDLGCGSGTFTVALAELLAPGSVVYAVDVEAKRLASIPDLYHGVEIHKIVANIIRDELPLLRFDGILMANALHFIKEQEAFLAKAKRRATRLLIVEYDHRPPSAWGPYPIGFQAFRELALHVGYSRVVKLRSRPSRFGGMMYSAVAEC
jgi:ubiquinone/menaquinone biosynthesis C-methylase UbiE